MGYTAMKWSPFRGWVHNLWVLNCEEHDYFHIPKDKERDYFLKYKWWLKNEYKRRRAKRSY